MANAERETEARRLLARLRELAADGELGLDGGCDFPQLPGTWDQGDAANSYLAVMRAVMEQSLGAAGETDRLERFSARISKAQKDLLERAAELQDRTLTDFVMSAAQTEAERVVRDRMAVTLSAVAFDAFADACIGANGEPNEALRNAAARQKKRVRSS
jgi:uncharacterized protein (DUF1778 family)